MFRKYSILAALLVASVVQTACSGPVVEARQARRVPWWGLGAGSPGSGGTVALVAARPA